MIVHFGIAFLNCGVASVANIVSAAITIANSATSSGAPTPMVPRAMSARSLNCIVGVAAQKPTAKATLSQNAQCRGARSHIGLRSRDRLLVFADGWLNGRLVDGSLLRISRPFK